MYKRNFFFEYYLSIGSPEDIPLLKRVKLLSGCLIISNLFKSVYLHCLYLTDRHAAESYHQPHFDFFYVLLYGKESEIILIHMSRPGTEPTTLGTVVAFSYNICIERI